MTKLIGNNSPTPSDHTAGSTVELGQQISSNPAEKLQFTDTSRKEIASSFGVCDAISAINYNKVMSEAKQQANQYTEKLPGQADGLGDAYRHVVGAAFLECRLWQTSKDVQKAENSARYVTDNHECLDDSLPSQMDRHNNEYGFKIARSLIQSGAITPTMSANEIGAAIWKQMRSTPPQEASIGTVDNSFNGVVTIPPSQQRY